MKFGRFHVQVYTIIYERWGTKQQKICEDAEVLNAYADEVLRLKDRGKYQYADLDALNIELQSLTEFAKIMGKNIIT